MWTILKREVIQKSHSHSISPLDACCLLLPRAGWVCGRCRYSAYFPCKEVGMRTLLVILLGNCDAALYFFFVEKKMINWWLAVLGYTSAAPQNLKSRCKPKFLLHQLWIQLIIVFEFFLCRDFLLIFTVTSAPKINIEQEQLFLNLLQTSL